MSVDVSHVGRVGGNIDEDEKWRDLPRMGAWVDMKIGC